MGKKKYNRGVTDQDLANGVKDEYGCIYSPDGKRLLKGCNVDTYAVKEGTDFINCF